MNTRTNKQQHPSEPAHDTHERLTAIQERFLAALLTTPTIGEAAKAVRIGETTAHRYLALPHVQAVWRELRRRAVEQALTGVQSVTSEAVAALRDCLAETMPPATRVRAATAILDIAMRTVEIGDLAARIEQLEQALEQQHSQQTQPASRWPGSLRQPA